jgi:hypothetical protein
MREISQLLAAIAVLATIGSFLIDLRQAVNEDGVPPRTAAEGPARSARESAAGEKPVTSEPECNGDVYEATVRRLRAQRKKSTTEPAGRVKWLGADPEFDYYYDYVADKLICLPHSKGNAPQVRPSAADNRKRKKRHVVWLSIVVIILSGVGLAAIEIARSGRSRR